MSKRSYMKTFEQLFPLTDTEKTVLARVFSQRDANLNYFITSDGTKLAFRQFGPKFNTKVLILVHGIASQSKMLIPIAETLTKKGITTILLDLRGHGVSEGTRGDSPTINRMTDDLSEFVTFIANKYKIYYPAIKNKLYDGIFLGGHSMGAFLCLKTIKEKNLAISGFIALAGGIPLFNKIPDKKYQDAASVFFGINNSTSKNNFVSFDKPAIHIKMPISYVQFGKINSNFTLDYTLRFFPAVFPMDINNIYQQIKLPVLILVGETDQFFDWQQIAPTLKLIPHANKKSIIYPDTDHIQIILHSGSDIAAWILSQKHV